MQEYGLNEQRVAGYKENRSDIFAGLQEKIIVTHLNEEAIKKMPASVAPLWFNSLFNNERLERGQATSINVGVMVDVLEAIRALRDK